MLCNDIWTIVKRIAPREKRMKRMRFESEIC